MATNTSNLLHLATTTNASTLNFHIPTINIKLDHNNYSLWRTTIISTLETFDLEDYVLNPKPPTETVDVAAIPATPATATSPIVVVIPATTILNPEYVAWKRRDRFVLLWRKSTLSDNPSALVARSPSSRIAWQTLEKLFKTKLGLVVYNSKLNFKPLQKGQ